MNTSGKTCDVFFSYNWRDREEVETVARALRERGLKVFLDRWYLVPGRPWPQALEEALANCRAAAVFLGPHGMGSWQQRESYLALDRQTREHGFSVIPILLPCADPALGFLSLNTWVDLRAGLEDTHSLAILAAAVQGEPPGPELQKRIRETMATICPYRDLRIFREEDAHFFFGRESFVDCLAEKMNRNTLVAVVGASGSGKSSVVRAGLVPRLRREVDGTTWDVATMVPNDNPLHALSVTLTPLLEPEMTRADQLKEAHKWEGLLAEGHGTLRDMVNEVLKMQPGTDRLLLVVDQWEELYTLCNDEHTRGLFLKELLEATVKEPLTAVLTLRGDFYSYALSYRPLVDRLQDARVDLGPMTRRELERAVVCPAQKIGLTFESELANRILDDVGDEPGKLPFLEFALTELWKRRDGCLLTHAAYKEVGKVSGAIVKRAEEEYEKLTSEQKEIAHRIFTRLVRIARPEEGGEDTRLRTELSQLNEDEREVIQKLANARLVVTSREEATGQETMEVAHEALIWNWNRLRRWLDEDREFLLWRQRFRAVLAEWERTRPDTGALLRGAPLVEAERWLKERSEDLNWEELSFIEKSVALRERERSLRERRRRRFTVASIGAATIFFVLSLLAWHQRREAREQSLIALSRQFAAQSSTHVDDQLDLALLLSVEACQVSKTVEARGSLLTALVSRPYISKLLHGHTDAVLSVAFSPDGRTLASGSEDNTIILWDLQNHQQIGQPLKGHTSSVLSVAFNPDGTTLASGSGDDTIIQWDVDVESWKARACRIANRNLTREEWQQYIGDESYRPTRPELPIPEG